MMNEMKKTERKKKTKLWMDCMRNDKESGLNYIVTADRRESKIKTGN